MSEGVRLLVQFKLSDPRVPYARPAMPLSLDCPQGAGVAMRALVALMGRPCALFQKNQIARWGRLCELGDASDSKILEDQASQCAWGGCEGTCASLMA